MLSSFLEIRVVTVSSSIDILKQSQYVVLPCGISFALHAAKMFMMLGKTVKNNEKTCSISPSSKISYQGLVPLVEAMQVFTVMS